MKSVLPANIMSPSTPSKGLSRGGSLGSSAKSFSAAATPTRASSSNRNGAGTTSRICHRHLHLRALEAPVLLRQRRPRRAVARARLHSTDRRISHAIRCWDCRRYPKRQLQCRRLMVARILHLEGCLDRRVLTLKICCREISFEAMPMPMLKSMRITPMHCLLTKQQLRAIRQ